MLMPIACPDFVAGGSIDPRNALDEFLFLKDGDEAENGGEVAALGPHLFVDIGEGEGNLARIEQLNDGDASMGGAQAVLPQPRRGVDGVRMRVFTHSYLYHKNVG